MTNYKNISGTQDAGSQYFWTIDAYEQVKTQKGSDTKDYVLINSDSKAVYKDYEVRYAIRVWKKKRVGNSYVEPSVANPAEPLYDGDGVQVLLLQSWRTEVADQVSIGDIVQTSSGSQRVFVKNTASKFPYYVDNSTQDSKEIFYFNLLAKKANVTVTPRIYVRLKPYSDENPGAVDLEVLPAENIPVVKWTGARMDPTIPNQVLEAAWNKSYITLDKCSTPNQWVAVVRSGDINPLLTNYYLRRWSLDGIQSTFTGANTAEKLAAGLGALGPDQFIGFDLNLDNPANVNKDFKGSDKKDSKQDAINALLAIKTSTCGAAVDNGSTEPSPYSSSKPIDIDQTTRTNPPNHYVSRDVSFFNKVKDNIQKDLGKPRAASGYIIAYDKIDLLNAEVTKAGRLGMIFQDKASATALNGPGNADKPWGFRFNYNPTTISYSTAMDTSIDWMLADKDPANYIGGNVSVGFTLYLNRMPDMTELAGMKGKSGVYGKNYPRELREEEIQGILNRGTEYDIEFLYRVLNGDPKPSNNTLLTYTVSGKPAETSDFGYITGTPVWLKIHNNLRYKGSVASVSVNHVIFNELMVPMFSTVDVTMIRYPVISETSDEVQKAFSEKQTKYVAGIKKAASAQ
jgi:hypothetical protein